MKLSRMSAIVEARRLGRRDRVRKKIRGTAATPRLAVFRSNRFIAAQLIDDEIGQTLASASSQDKSVVAEGSRKSKSVAAVVGAKLAEAAKQKGIETVVFDKGWYKYHGRVRALADAAREAGLKF